MESFIIGKFDKEGSLNGCSLKSNTFCFCQIKIFCFWPSNLKVSSNSIYFLMERKLLADLLTKD